VFILSLLIVLSVQTLYIVPYTTLFRSKFLSDWTESSMLCPEERKCWKKHWHTNVKCSWQKNSSLFFRKNFIWKICTFRKNIFRHLAFIFCNTTMFCRQV